MVSWKARYAYNSVDKYKRLVGRRSTPITKKNLGKFYRVYNGKRYFVVKVVEKHIGYKFGEFVYTRAKAGHQKNSLSRKQKKRKKRKKKIYGS